MEKIFVSFPFEKTSVATYIAQQLKKNSNDDVEISIYPGNVDGIANWRDQIIADIKESKIFIFIVGSEVRPGQLEELKTAILSKINIWRINTETGNNAWSEALDMLKIESEDIKQILETDIENWDSAGALNLDGTLSNIFRKRKAFWKYVNYRNDGLPLNNQIFNYEKKIIEFYYNYNKYSIKIKDVEFAKLTKEEKENILKKVKDKVLEKEEKRNLISEEDWEKTLNKIRENILTKEEWENFIKRLKENILENEDWEMILQKVREDILNKVKSSIFLGVPAEWPAVRIRERRPKMEMEDLDPGVQEEIGYFRDNENYVLSAALSEFHKNIELCPCIGENKLIFPEAGPRKTVFKTKTKTKFRIGILVSGGIAPGINALIDGITRRHYFYAYKAKQADSLEVLGLLNGFNSLEPGDEIQKKILYPNEVNKHENSIVTSNITNEGGSVIGTSRFQPLVDDDFMTRLETLYEIVRRLRSEGIRILYIIGGEGSMKAAQAIQKRADQFVKDKKIKDWDLCVVGIPKTMDNDILWVWQTFGFMSAVEKAREFIEYLYVESKSNPRWGIVQLFGSNSGFVVSHAVLACKSDICDLALIPEMEYKLENVVKYVQETGKDHGLIVLAETAVPYDVQDYLNKKEIQEILTKDEINAIKGYKQVMRKIDCHVNDDLRSGVVKIIAWALETEAEKRVFINEPRHLLRSLPPSTIDIITASRLGTLAVDNAMAGYYGFMISQWLTEFCLVPLELVVLGRKRIPPEGIFFKSVIKKTGQPQKLY